MDQLTTQQRVEIVSDDEQFRMYVMETLGELKTDMKGIVGNGQPGRLSKLEAKVAKHEWYLAVAIGAALILGYVVQYAVALAPTMLRSGK